MIYIKITLLLSVLLPMAWSPNKPVIYTDALQMNKGINTPDGEDFRLDFCCLLCFVMFEA